MTVRFAAPLYPGGRHCLLCGTMTVGAAFPPVTIGEKWGWRLWACGEQAATEGRAKSEQAAKNALLARFRDFLRAAELVEAK